MFHQNSGAFLDGAAKGLGRGFRLAVDIQILLGILCPMFTLDTQILHSVSFQNYATWDISSVYRVLGKDWDIYVITALALLLGLVVVMRRRR